MYTLNTPGLFIAVEGIDGAGSSTLTEGITKALIRLGRRAFATKEPTNNMIGGLIRGFLTHEWNPSPRTRQQLYAADRSHHLDRVILPNLRDEAFVVTDRYFWSTFAFGMLDLKLFELEQYNMSYPYPDITFFTDVPVEVAQERMVGTRDRLELFEKGDLPSRVRANYLHVYEQYGSDFITLLDGRLPPEELVRQAMEVIMSHPLITTGRRPRRGYCPVWNVEDESDRRRSRHGWGTESEE